MKMVISVIFLAFIIVFSSQATSFAEMQKPSVSSQGDKYQDMFVSLLLPKIDKPIYKYYSNYITDYPKVYPYFVKIINVKRADIHYVFFVTVEVTPVVGPHIPLGIDRLTYRIIPGHAKLLKFEHIKSNELPDKWKHIQR